MNKEDGINFEHIDRSLSSLDSWVDAFKDISLVSGGIMASYLSLAYGGAIGISLILIILAVSILSGMFLPYKIAVTRRSELGVFSRYRAIELMIVIFFSWLVPTGLVLIFPGILAYLPPLSSTRLVTNLLTFILPYTAFLVAIFFGAYGLLGIFRRIGIPNEFFERYANYPWGLGLTGLWVVSLTVINVQLLLLEAIQTYTQSIELAVLIYARVFGGLIVLIMFCCTLSYFEPKRILTKRGELIFGVVGAGVFIALAEPLIGFIISIIGILILIWYSLSIPPPDIESIIAEKNRIDIHEDFRTRWFRIVYGRKARVLSCLNYLLFFIGIGGFLILIIFEINDQIPILSQVLTISFIAWSILFVLVRSEQSRLYIRLLKVVTNEIDDVKKLSNEELLALFEFTKSRKKDLS